MYVRKNIYIHTFGTHSATPHFMHSELIQLTSSLSGILLWSCINFAPCLTARCCL